ncbi:MAG: tetratricopeptide repeat protein [Ferruginibacter sp.]
MKKIIYLPLFLLVACRPNEKAAEMNPIKTPDQLMTDAIRTYPDSLLLKENLAQYYRENNKYDLAISVVNDVLVKDSGNARFWDIKGTLQIENGDTAAAVRSFEKSIDFNPLPEVVISLGVLYAQTRNPLALGIADGLMQASKAAAEKEALFIKGLYFSYTGDKSKAVVLFNQCIALNYTFMEAHREKEVALYEAGKYEEAYKALDKAVTIQNNFDEGYFFMGRCLEKLNKPVEAIQMYERALLYDPNYLEAKNALAKLGVKQ